MSSISAIILTRDSQRSIEQCIQAIKFAVDTVIVVDTGSVDDTIAIAKAIGAHVYHFEWRDDFAAARNFGDSIATTDWVIHVDSDEILRKKDTHKIRKLCAQYKKTIRPVVVTIQKLNISADSMDVSDAARMYRRGTVVWKGIIHEQLFSRRSGAIDGIKSDISFEHDGYNAAVVNTREKYERNIRLLQIGVGREPNNSIYHFFLGRDYGVIGEYERAIPHLRMAIDLLEQEKMFEQLDFTHRVLIECLELAGDIAGAEEIANRMVNKFH
jgi:glycosyltransferase involved in cell wall biosynthesis